MEGESEERQKATNIGGRHRRRDEIEERERSEAEGSNRRTKKGGRDREGRAGKRLRGK
jgi:hypothetical protein